MYHNTPCYANIVREWYILWKKREKKNKWCEWMKFVLKYQIKLTDSWLMGECLGLHIKVTHWKDEWGWKTVTIDTGYAIWVTVVLNKWKKGISLVYCSKIEDKIEKQILGWIFFSKCKVVNFYFKIDVRKIVSLFLSCAICIYNVHWLTFTNACPCSCVVLWYCSYG